MANQISGREPGAWTVGRFRNKVVVITGGSAGVGRATARAFAENRAKVAVLARGAERLDDTVRELRALGAEAMSVQADVAVADQVESAARQVEETLGPIDIWVNNAMATVYGPFKQIRPEEFRRVTEVTYLGMVYGTMAALKRMLPRGSGVIVQVGSSLAYRSIPLQSAYCGAKHGIRGFTDSIRSELIHDKSRVHITMVQLPALNTPQFDWGKSYLPQRVQPLPPIYQPELAADAILFAASHRRREIYVGMQTVKVMWGNKLIAGWIDRILARRGYEGQQTSEPEDPSRPDNLWEPVEGYSDSHGRFGSSAQPTSLQWWAAKHIGWYRGMTAVLLLGAVAAGVAFQRSMQQKDRS
jgi:NAD(P)-dependent dehydrogenase (short-subunit alcohol dehydrogenase family)